MRIALIIMADIMILVTALLAVHEFGSLRRYDSFVVPFTDKLIAHGAVAPDRRERILREDRISHIIGLILCAVVWLMLSRFFAGLSGYLAFPIGFAALSLALRPENGETKETRAQYYNAHKSDIDPIKYSAIFEEEPKG